MKKVLILINDEARGLKELKLAEGAELSTMKELTQLSMESDKMITF